MLAQREDSRLKFSCLSGAHSDRKVLWVEVPSALAMAQKYDCPGLEAAAERTVAEFVLDFKNLLDFLTWTDRYKLLVQRKRGIEFFHDHINNFHNRCFPYNGSLCNWLCWSCTTFCIRGILAAPCMIDD